MLQLIDYLSFVQFSILSEEGVIIYNNNELDEMGDTIYNAILLL